MSQKVLGLLLLVAVSQSSAANMDELQPVVGNEAVPTPQQMLQILDQQAATAIDEMQGMGYSEQRMERFMNSRSLSVFVLDVLSPHINDEYEREGRLRSFNQRFRRFDAFGFNHKYAQEHPSQELTDFLTYEQTVLARYAQALQDQNLELPTKGLGGYAQKEDLS